jgi:hypothetical protein
MSAQTGSAGGSVASPVLTAPPGSIEVRLIDATPTATAAAFRSDRAELAQVVWATTIDPRTKAPTTIVTEFLTDTPIIYAVVPIGQIAAGTELTASWTYNHTPLDGFLSTVTAERDATEIWAEFHIALTSAEPWPEGSYQINILVNGEPALIAQVTVVEGQLG